MRRPDRFFRKMTAREGFPGFIGYLLSPLGLLYGSAVSFSRFLHEGRGKRLGVPVLSIGNIEVGGTGKTPVTVWLARRISGMGYRVCVVVRNFGSRKTPGPVLPGSPGTSAGYSDEVLLLASRLLGRARIYSGRSKLRAAEKAAKEREPDIILVDDGFQHFGLHRNIDLVVLDFDEPFGRGGLLPAGTLREFPSALTHADHLWINRVRAGMSAEWIQRRVAEYNWKAPVLFSRIRPDGLRLAVSDERVDIPSGSRVLAFCGIGRPSSFRETLEEAGFEVAFLQEFPDHHEYTEADIGALLRTTERIRAEYMITTEKDAVKLRRMQTAETDPGEILMLRTALEVDGAVEVLLGRIERVIRTSSFGGPGANGQ